MVWDEIPDERENWNNRFEGKEVMSVDSATACKEACDSNPDCLQSAFDGKGCFLNTESFRLGESQNSTADEKARYSFWNGTRIADWVAKHQQCGETTFPMDRLDRRI
jgi:hypothetical protein